MLNGFFIISEIFIFFFFRKVMQGGLNYYYEANFKRYRWIALFNFMYFATSLILLIVWIYLEIDPGELKSMKLHQKYSPGEKILWLLLIICYNLPIYFYIYLNTRNVDFKLYVYNLLKGRSLYKVIGNASIFIIRSRCAKKASEYLTESSIESSTWSDQDIHENVGERQTSSLNEVVSIEKPIAFYKRYPH